MAAAARPATHQSIQSVPVRPAILITLNRDDRAQVLERLNELEKLVDGDARSNIKNIINQLMTRGQTDKITRSIAIYNKTINSNSNFTLPVLRIVSKLDDTLVRGVPSKTIVHDVATAGLALEFCLNPTDFKEKTTAFATSDATQRADIAEDVGTPDGSFCLCRTETRPCFCVASASYTHWLTTALEDSDNFIYKNKFSDAHFNDLLKSMSDAMSRFYYKCPIPECTKLIPVLRLIGILNEAAPGKENKDVRNTLKDKLEQLLIVRMSIKFPFAFAYCQNGDCSRCKDGKAFLAVSVKRSMRLIYCAVCKDNHNAYLHRVTCPECETDTCAICRCKEYHTDRPCTGPYTELDDMDEATRAAIFADAVRCPGCRQAVGKVVGCDHMTCPCGTHFCYRCAQRLDPHNPYRHECPRELAGAPDPHYHNYELAPDGAPVVAAYIPPPPPPARPVPHPRVDDMPPPHFALPDEDEEHQLAWR